jgi:hypothetical protein
MEASMGNFQGRNELETERLLRSNPTLQEMKARMRKLSITCDQSESRKQMQAMQRDWLPQAQG